MNLSKIHVRYAKALFQLAMEKGVLEKVRNDMELLLNIFTENDDLKRLAATPTLKAEARRKIYQELFVKYIDKLTFSFIELLLENKREEFIPGIARRFIYLYKKEKKILSVTLTSAELLSDEMVNLIMKKLKEMFVCEVEFDLKTDSKLIGGFQLKIGDTLVDASVNGELRKIRNELLKGAV